MPDFSGASLKLKAEGEEKVLATLDRIDKKANDVVDNYVRLSQSEVEKAAAAFDRLYGKATKSASDFAKQQIQYEREVAAEHLARMRQQAAADKAYETEVAAEWMARMRQMGRETGGVSHSAALGIGELARGLGRVAESGNLSAFAVREFTGSAFRLGNALGSAGLGAGVGLAAIAIGGLVEYFQSASKKADEMAVHIQQAFDKIAHSSTLLSASEEQQFAFSGDPLSRLVPRGPNESTVAFIKRTLGQRGLADEAMRLNAEIDKLKASPLFNAGTGAGGRNIGLETLANQLKEVNKAVGELGMNISIADQRRRQLNDITAEAARIGIDAKQAKIKHVPEFGTTDPYRREENAALNLRPGPEYAEMARLAAQIPDPLKEIGDKMKADQAADMFQIEETLKAQLKGVFKQLDEQAREMQQKAQEIGNAIVNGITSGIRAAFSGGGLTAGFKELTAAILNGLGEMLAQTAEKALIASQFMQRILSLLPTNPWAAAAAAVAMLAFANSLRSSGGSSGGSGGGYGSGGSLPQIVNTGVVTASAPQGPVTSASSIQSRAMQQNTIYVIGEDPKAWRQVQERLDQNARRG